MKMEKELIWRIVLWLVSIFGIGLTLILYATDHLNRSNYVACSLQECILLNETCTQICPEHQPSCIPANFTCHFHLANYSFIFRHQTYFTTQRLFVEQACLERITCYFSDPNSDIHFENHDQEASLSVGILIIGAMISFCTCCIMIPFEYFWRTKIHPEQISINLPPSDTPAKLEYEPI